MLFGLGAGGVQSWGGRRDGSTSGQPQLPGEASLSLHLKRNRSGWEAWSRGWFSLDFFFFFFVCACLGDLRGGSHPKSRV